MRTQVLAPVGIALAATMMPAAASAQSQQGITFDQIADVLKSEVVSSERRTTDDGEVYFDTAVNGADGQQYGVVIAPRECSGTPVRCSVVTIYANFDWGSQPDAAALGKVIDYNDTHVRGRAYAFDDSVGVDHQVMLGDGAGVNYLKARIREFPQILADFVAAMKD